MSGGFSAAYRELLPQFESTTGITVTTATGASQGDGPGTSKRSSQGCGRRHSDHVQGRARRTAGGGQDRRWLRRSILPSPVGRGGARRSDPPEYRDCGRLQTDAASREIHRHSEQQRHLSEDESISATGYRRRCWKGNSRTPGGQRSRGRTGDDHSAGQRNPALPGVDFVGTIPASFSSSRCSPPPW